MSGETKRRDRRSLLLSVLMRSPPDEVRRIRVRHRESYDRPRPGEGVR